MSNRLAEVAASSLKKVMSWYSGNIEQKEKLISSFIHYYLYDERNDIKKQEENTISPLAAHLHEQGPTSRE